MEAQRIPFGGYASIAEEHPERYGIRIDERVFPMRQWREGILFFLNRAWSSPPRVEKRMINFGNVALSSANDGERYYVTGVAPDEPITSYVGGYSLEIGDQRLEVHDALVRFAKDDRLGMISIRFADAKVLTLAKRERPGEYSCSLR